MLKEISQTFSKLTLPSKLSMTGVILMLFIAVLFGGVPLLVIIAIVGDHGITTLSCQRIQSTQVNCDTLLLQFFGLVKQPSTSLERVFEPKYQSVISEDGDGNEIVNHFITLNTSEGEVNVFTGNPVRMQEFIAQINTFIKSNQPYFVIEQDTRLRWFPDIFTLAFFGFMLSWIFSIVPRILKTETQTFDKTT